MSILVHDDEVHLMNVGGSAPALVVDKDGSISKKVAYGTLTGQIDRDGNITMERKRETPVGSMGRTLNEWTHWTGRLPSEINAAIQRALAAQPSP